MWFNKRPGAAEMPFLDHLEELRWRILKSLAAIGVGLIAGAIVVTQLQVLEWLVKPALPYLPKDGLISVGPLEPFYIQFQLALTIGFLLAFPVVAVQVWAFISPALHKREKRMIVPALYFGLLLFAGGAALAYYAVLPMTLKFGQSFTSPYLTQMVTASSYMALVIKLMIAFGVVFELPVVVLVLSAMGLVTSKFLREKRRFAIAGSAIAAALLTPGDALSATFFMMGPLIILYEVSIVLAMVMERRRARALLQDSLQEAMPEAS